MKMNISRYRLIENGILRGVFPALVSILTVSILCYSAFSGLLESCLSLQSTGTAAGTGSKEDLVSRGRDFSPGALAVLRSFPEMLLAGMNQTADQAKPGGANSILYEGFEAEKFPVVEYEKNGGFYDLHGYPDLMYISGEEAAAGAHCLELVHPAGVISPQWIHRKFPGQDSVFVRFYRKWEKDWAWPVLGAHDILIFAGKYENPVSTDLTLYLDLPQGPTIRNGKDNWDLSGQPELVLKSSYQGPGLDFGVGREIISHVGFDNYYGLPYNKNPAPLLEGGRWYCFEFMAKMNSAPAAKDGAVRLWIDGTLITEMTGLTLRDAGHMDIRWDHWMLGPRYGGEGFKTGPPKEQKSWFDELVISWGYIGPGALQGQ